MSSTDIKPALDDADSALSGGDFKLKELHTLLHTLSKYRAATARSLELAAAEIALRSIIWTVDERPHLAPPRPWGTLPSWQLGVEVRAV